MSLPLLQQEARRDVGHLAVVVDLFTQYEDAEQQREELQTMLGEAAREQDQEMGSMLQEDLLKNIETMKQLDQQVRSVCVCERERGDREQDLSPLHTPSLSLSLSHTHAQHTSFFHQTHPPFLCLFPSQGVTFTRQGMEPKSHLLV